MASLDIYKDYILISQPDEPTYTFFRNERISAHLSESIFLCISPKWLNCFFTLVNISSHKLSSGHQV